ncbi:ketosteroid isomerase [Pseudoflavitalea sp. X16]|uniref:ketosteroid isomerase n=1 Tax=Paraflavitalea devenefica TaxID=2716334 RepID=UPI001420E142|nr:ketosteroid isomerase [Paraflavitalea devenefica]NII24666.1 ketosteroid isomerase [Paraflavitalea devenefica]
MSEHTHTTNDVDSAAQQILMHAYNAFNARDVEAALVCMDVDVDWPNGMEGGYLYGHKAVHDYWVRQWNMIDPHVDPVSFTNGEDGNIMVEVHQVVYDLEGNIILDETVYHSYLILQGLIKRMEIRKKEATLLDTQREPLPFQ